MGSVGVGGGDKQATLVWREGRGGCVVITRASRCGGFVARVIGLVNMH